jgi:hypothetical protein
MNSAEVRQALDLETPHVAGVRVVVADEDAPSGAAAAFALLATMGAGVGVLAGALLF